MNDFMILNSIASALGTAEQGEALIEVAHNAHKAEMQLAHFLRLVQDDDLSIEIAYQKVFKND